MKIQSSVVNLSSKTEMHQSLHVQTQEKLQFNTVFGQALFARQAGDTAREQFKTQLARLQMLARNIFRQLNSNCLKDCTIAGGNFSTLFVIPVNRTLFDPFKADYTRTVTQTVRQMELQKSRFAANGNVVTEDGTSIDFDFEFALRRQFVRTEQFEKTEQGEVLIDPLVISYNGVVPAFSGATLSIDLDMDGNQDEIAMPDAGTGFLSLDLNNDGIINDGSELFGPSTGDGFAHLSEFDEDHNNWIDENDAIFDQLKIWENNGNDEMVLKALKDTGVGAICLANAANRFDLKSEDNELYARIKKTGFALNEDGSVNPVHEVDWSVS